jgi:nucleoside-diphosphate-sugar epimerase
MNLRGKRVLITGANGFIGGRLAERLGEEEGAQVRAMVRNVGATLAIAQQGQPRGLPLQTIAGDLTDADAMKRAVDDCDIVVHCAAMQYHGMLDDFRRVNVDGTLNLLRAAKDAGVARFIHISTINVHGYPPPENANADSPLVFKGDAYSISKAEGERAAREFCASYQLPLTIIRPACTYGPRSKAWTLTPLERVKRGAPVLIGKGDGICNAVYIDNLIDLILLAMQNDAAIGQAFIGAEGRGVTWRDFYGAYAKMIEVSQLRALPRTLALGVANASEFVASVTGRAPFVSRASVEFYSHPIVFEIEKSRRILGYEPKISFDEGMQRTQAWLTRVHFLS